MGKRRAPESVRVIIADLNKIPSGYYGPGLGGKQGQTTQSGEWTPYKLYAALFYLLNVWMMYPVYQNIGRSLLAWLKSLFLFSECESYITFTNDQLWEVIDWLTKP